MTRSIYIRISAYVGLITIILTLLSTQSYASNISSPWQESQQNPGLLCEYAARKAERKHGVPRLLLMAIGMTESGRWNADTQSGSPWPWTVTSGGPGSYFPNMKNALTYVTQLKSRGIKNIDIGCFQINQYYHPDAFESLQQAFNPDTNADYAARFLKSLRKKHGSWMRAVAIYHSSTPDKGLAYRKKVYDRLNALHIQEQNNRQLLFTEIARFRQLRHNYIMARKAYDRKTGNTTPQNYSAKVYANNSHITKTLF